MPRSERLQEPNGRGQVCNQRRLSPETQNFSTILDYDVIDMLEILNLQLSKNALAVLYSHCKKCSLEGAISSGIQNSEHDFCSASNRPSQVAKIDQSAEEDGIWPQIANFLKTWRSHFEDDLCLERLRFGDAGGSWRPLSSRLSGLEGLTRTVYTILKSNVLP